jgi:hypothetical protein
MRRKRTDVLKGLGSATRSPAAATTGDEEEFAQPKFQPHKGTSPESDEDEEKTNQPVDPREERAPPSAQVDAFEASLATWIARNFKTIAVAIISTVSVIVIGVFYGTFHVTKFQSTLDNTQQDVKDIRTDVRKLGEDSLRHKHRVDQLEKNHERLERSLDSTRRPNR